MTTASPVGPTPVALACCGASLASVVLAVARGVLAVPPSAAVVTREPDIGAQRNEDR